MRIAPHLQDNGKKAFRRIISWSVPHVPVAHGRHCDHRPPERVRYRFEEALLRTGLREVDHRAEQDHA